MSSAAIPSVNILVIYSAEDEKRIQELQSHLYALRPQPNYTFYKWGSLTGQMIMWEKNLEVADILLVFAGSGSLNGNTIQTLLRQAERRELPVLLATGAATDIRELSPDLPLLASCSDQDTTGESALLPEKILAGLASAIELQQLPEIRTLIRKEKESRSGELLLDEAGLEHIPVDVLSMPWLTRLSLKHNRISRMSHLDNLVQLEELLLAGNQIATIGNTETLGQLKKLDLKDNRVGSISNLEHNIQLQVLGLSGNSLEKVTGLAPLKELQALYLGHNQLQSLNGFPFLPELKRIVLTNNPFPSVKPLLRYIRSGLKVEARFSFEPEEQGIFVKECLRLAEPSLEVVQQGNEAILKYFSEAEQLGTRKLELVKLILVGNSRVGKTNLSEYLRTDAINTASASTHLLDIQEWDAPFLRSEEGKLTRVNIFDFGGQDYYHDAHRMFYSHDTAYILLWDGASNTYSRKEEVVAGAGEPVSYEDFPLSYWLESIRYNLGSRRHRNYYNRTPDNQPDMTLADAAPVLVLQNKIDQGEQLLDQQALQRAYPNIRQFFSVSLQHKKRTAIFNEVLSDYFHALNLSGRQLLPYEHQLVEHFREHKDEELAIISLDTFREGCVRLLNDDTIDFNTDNAEILAQVLNNTGICFYDRNSEGGGTLYTNIRLLNERIKAIMDIARKGNDKGVFSKEQVAGIEGHEAILALLCRNKSIIDIRGRHFIAPQFLPLGPDESVAFFLQAFVHTQVRFVYTAYFHKSLLLNLFAAYIDREKVDLSEAGIKAFPFWRNGIIIKRERGSQKEWVLVSFEKDEKAGAGVVAVKTMKPFHKSGLEGDIVKTLDELNAGWTVDKQVSVNSTDYFSLADMQEKSRSEKQYLFYTNGRAFRINDFRNLADFEHLPKKLFLSYSSKNAEFIKRFVTHLEVLKAKGEIEPWYDRMIDPGTRWDDSIRREMAQSDVVIFLLSPDFLATEYIMKVEVPLALQRQRTEGLQFFFIQLQPCLWEETVLANFQQTGNARDTWKNVITIGAPESNDRWIDAIRELKKRMAGVRTEYGPLREEPGQTDI